MSTASYSEKPKRNAILNWLAADTMAGIKRQRAIMGYLFIAPTVIGLLVFIVGPMLYSFVLSFHEWNVFRPPEYVGLANFERLAGDTRVFVSFKNTFILVLMTVSVLEVLAMSLALLVKRLTGGFLGYFYRTVYFLPVLLSGASVAVMLGYMFHTDFGVINYYLGQLGIQKVPWLTNTSVVLITISLTTVWRNLGFTFIIYLGGVSALPEEILEAADVDGAKGWRKLWSITLPLLSPTILFATVTDVIKMLQFFDEPFIMTRGGPGDASRTVVMMMYDSAFGNLELGYGSAIALALFAVIMIVTGIQFYLSRRWVFYG
ncbi:MAG: sugar ABC transporter permease [Anaerolineae bacterium]|nr:sugar ABC transporter permease [Anaerolineae bacterium]MCA9890107.1 sugar ABC transporter permease [Anaerolineae bacterium]MCA9892521.1 sugar ABC transporter permease [Anaerolineae bacterium]